MCSTYRCSTCHDVILFYVKRPCTYEKIDRDSIMCSNCGELYINQYFAIRAIEKKTKSLYRQHTQYCINLKIILDNILINTTLMKYFCIDIINNINTFVIK